MKTSKNELVKKIAVIGLLTALATVLSLIAIPIVGSASVTLVLPVVVIGAALYGPWVGAWLTVIPNLIAFREAGMFLTYSPFGCILTIMLKGLAAGFAAGLVYKLLSKKHPYGAVTCAAIVAPILNSGIFVLGCRIFLWEKLIEEAAAAGVTMTVLLLGLAGINFAVELILNVVLCPAILKIIRIATKKKMV